MRESGRWMVLGILASMDLRDWIMRYLLDGISM